MMMLLVLLAVAVLLISPSSCSPEALFHQNSKRQAPPDQFTGKPSAPTLQWFPCYPDTFPQPECARLEVPYDYSRPVPGDIFKLAIVKFPADRTVPYKGIQFLSFFNPPFVESIASFPYPFTQGLLAGYDLISWDPRAVGHTEPGLKCFADDTAQAAYAEYLFSDQFTPYGGFNGTFPATDKNIKANIKSVTDTFKKLSDGCVTYSSNVLPYMGTADNARDLHKIVSLLPAGQKIMTYYGPASAIGLTYAAMYPTGFDSMTFDGAINVEELYATGLNSPSAVQDGDKALQMFFDSCAAAGPNTCDPTTNFLFCPSYGCYFWRPTGKEVKARYEALKAKFYFKPFKSVPPNPICGDCTLTYSAISHYIASALDLPALFQGLVARVSKALLEIESGSAFPLGEVEFFSDAFPHEVVAYDRILPCLDAKSVIRSTDGLVAHMKLMNKTSSQNGLAVAAQEAMCSTFPRNVNLKHRFTGDFTTKKHNAMIFISNTADPEESRANARAIASRFANARFITVNEFGMTSFFSGFSACKQNLLDNWRITGVLPPRNSVCNDVVAGPFNGGYA